MALQKGLAEGGTSSSTASNNQGLQAEPPPNSENQMCPICLDIINNPVSVSWCSHAFCFPCILEWSRNRPVCPICREPFRHLLRKVGDNNYEVYSIGHYISSIRRNRGRRHRRHSADRRRHHSADHGQHRSSSRERGNSHPRVWERDRSRSRRRNHGGHSRGQQAQSFDPSASRRWQHGRTQDTTSETSRGWNQAARHEQDAPVRSGRSEHRQRAQWDLSRESQATSRRSHRYRRTYHTSEQHRDRTQDVTKTQPDFITLNPKKQRLCQPVPLEKSDAPTFCLGLTHCPAPCTTQSANARLKQRHRSPVMWCM